MKVTKKDILSIKAGSSKVMQLDSYKDCVNARSYAYQLAFTDPREDVERYSISIDKDKNQITIEAIKKWTVQMPKWLQKNSQVYSQWCEKGCNWNGDCWNRRVFECQTSCCISRMEVANLIQSNTWYSSHQKWQESHFYQISFDKIHGKKIIPDGFGRLSGN